MGMFWKHFCKCGDKTKGKDKDKDCAKCHGHHGHKCVFYGMGVIGAAVFYISTATGFWMGVLGVLKALVWPAMLVFHLLKFFM